MYEFAADLTLIVHFAFILFVIFGALLYFVLNKILYFHFPTLIWGIYIELTNSVCPLTDLENWFLQRANLEVYYVSFVQNYIGPIVYPVNLTEDLQTGFAAGLIIINLIVYAGIAIKSKKSDNLP